MAVVKSLDGEAKYPLNMDLFVSYPLDIPSRQSCNMLMPFVITWRDEDSDEQNVSIEFQAQDYSGNKMAGCSLNMRISPTSTATDWSASPISPYSPTNG